ncbi:hypothetical protein WR164_02630 [Philodulcilactobacillus myokoensis]|uniref:HTH cro/C1-type domain-containing protein n=1 Tax=Philodulcilactobacillus myokoensis TaxID=2929573 RepID=A0A9W6ESM0_9LACO|nr:helix-turn-helix transcriptional regulator [Philodulcilactobacillus myokoensis]GLB46284.1 hypothetical protein WR164_02630 [Philodulcilactobacillus myokoensis]
MTNLPELLKAKRQQLGLTQAQMAAGVLSASFYSKVENGISDINTMDLIQILRIHRIDAGAFINQIKTPNLNLPESDYSKLFEKIYVAMYSNHPSKIKRIRRQMDQIKTHDKHLKVYKLMADLDLAMMNHQLKHFPNRKKVILRKALFSDPNLSLKSLQIFANTMWIYDFEELAFLVNAVLRQYQKHQQKNIHYQISIAAIMINFVEICYHQNEFQMAKRPLECIDNLEPIPDLFLMKLYGLYFELKMGFKKETKLFNPKTVIEVFNRTGLNLLNDNKK